MDKKEACYHQNGYKLRTSYALLKLTHAIEINYFIKMKKYFLLTFLILKFFFMSGDVYGQQNFFNIPSGQITPDGEMFYQHQVNLFARDSLSSKQHFVRGIGKSTEVGFNFLNFYPLGKVEKDKEGVSGPESNILAPTFQHGFQFDHGIALNVGFQAGLSHIGMDKPKYGTAKSYALLTYYNKENHFRVTAGDWFSGTRFNGPSDYHGFLVGGEWMFSEGIYLMGDWISGNTKNSVSVIGGMIDLKPGIQFCGGYLIPNPQSTEGHGLVIELNVFTM